MDSMPQIQLPIFPAGCQNINDHVAFERRDQQVTYFNGHLPVFTHEASDVQSFRLFTTQLIVNGSATQKEIVEAFGVSLTTVKRCVKKYRQGGSKALFQPPRRRQGTKLNPERLEEVQFLLNQGLSVPAISQQVGVLATTLHKAIDQGRLQIKKKILPRQALPAQRLRPSAA
jgi:transposase-like protein